MQQFIELKQETEFLFAMAGVMIIFGYVGYSYGEFQKAGGNIMDIISNLNYHRAKTVLKGLIR